MEIEELKVEIDQWLRNYFYEKGCYNKIIYNAMDYSLNIGGKRIRPLLLILNYLLYNENYKEVLPVAGAVEMIHTYSLIHDDLPCMDNDDLRRGKPTNHKVFGEAIAVLAGDGLLNEAMTIMFQYCSYKIENKRTAEACLLISQCSGIEGMIGGQVVDIMNEGKNISFDELEYMHRKKTGALIKAAILAGAILGNAPQNELEILELYGEKLGLAFQIKDDVLDVTGDTKTLGKPVFSDESNNKTTFVTIHGLEKCRKLCEDLTEECMSLLLKLPRDTEKLKAITKLLLQRQF